MPPSSSEARLWNCWCCSAALVGFEQSEPDSLLPQCDSTLDTCQQSNSSRSLFPACQQLSENVWGILSDSSESTLSPIHS